MKVLWIVNMVLPNLSNKLNISGGKSGTWMFDIADKLSCDKDVSLAVVCVYGKTFRKVEVENVTYYLLPGNGKDMMFYRKKFIKYYRQIISEFQPDVVNIHGTEYTHALSFIREYKDKIKTVISLQGLISKIQYYDLAGIKKSQIIFNKTLKEWIKFNGVYENHLLHVKNAKSETELIKSVKYVMAVDDWHASVAKEINKDAKIFKVNYNLRQEFYTSRKWDVNQITRYKISTNPGGTALKGLHNLLRAVALVKQKYPEVKVCVPGMKSNENGLVANTGYAKYLKKLINKLKIQENVEFLGVSSTQQMIDNMLSAHINVIPSCIEGPSLILREGMHLGVPTIASFVGGMADFVSDKNDGFLYRFSDYQMLALRIEQIFENDELAQKLSKNAILKAEKAHDQNANYKDVKKMYEEIIKD